VSRLTVDGFNLSRLAVDRAEKTWFAEFDAAA